MQNFLRLINLLCKILLKQPSTFQALEWEQTPVELRAAPGFDPYPQEQWVKGFLEMEMLA